MQPSNPSRHNRKPPTHSLTTVIRPHWGQVRVSTVKPHNPYTQNPGLHVSTPTEVGEGACLLCDPDHGRSLGSHVASRTLKLSVDLSICVSIDRSIHPFIYASSQSSIQPSIGTSNYLSAPAIYPFVHLPIYLSTYLLQSLSTYLPAYLPAYLSIISLSVCLSTDLASYSYTHHSPSLTFIFTYACTRT